MKFPLLRRDSLQVYVAAECAGDEACAYNSLRAAGGIRYISPMVPDYCDAARVGSGGSGGSGGNSSGGNISVHPIVP